VNSDTGGDAIQARLRLALRAALKTKDTVAASALRSVLAAISNAEAVPPHPGTTPVASQHVAGGAAGLGSAEAERKILSRQETARIIEDEIFERRAAIRQYEAVGRPELAERLRHEIQVIQSAAQA
jgi:hypothetical protein